MDVLKSRCGCGAIFSPSVRTQRVCSACEARSFSVQRQVVMDARKLEERPKRGDWLVAVADQSAVGPNDSDRKREARRFHDEVRGRHLTQDQYAELTTRLDQMERSGLVTAADAFKLRGVLVAARLGSEARLWADEQDAPVPPNEDAIRIATYDDGEQV